MCQQPTSRWIQIVNWQCHDEARTSIIRSIKHYITAQTPSNRTGYSQSDASTIIILIQLNKFFKDMISLLNGNAYRLVIPTETAVFYGVNGISAGKSEVSDAQLRRRRDQ